MSQSKFPPPPKHLKAEGKEKWKLGEELWNEGRLTARDLYAWSLYAEAWDEKARCEARVEADGEYQCAPNGCYARHPAVKGRKEAEQVIYKYSQLYGLVPEARRKAPAAQQGVAARKRD